MKRRPASQRRSRYVALGASAALLSGGYLLFPSPVNGTLDSLGRNVVVPAADFVTSMVVPSLNRLRRSFVLTGEMWDQWFPSLPENFRIRPEEGGYLEMVREGNGMLMVSSANMLADMSKFMFVQLPQHMNKFGLAEGARYLRHYLRPLKMLFTRPELERFQSHKSRLDQFVNAFGNSKFPATLASMNGFYMKFREQMETLGDERLAEMIDIYLEDPVAMKNKVDLIMERLGEDEELIGRNFDGDLMMDFVRGENIDRLKAKIAASKVSEELNRFASLFSGVSPKYDKSNLTGDGGINESIEGIFVSTVT